MATIAPRGRFIALIAIFISIAWSTIGFAQAPDTTQKIPQRNYRNKADLNRGVSSGWAVVMSHCDKVDEACAQAANIEVTTECAAAAQLLTKDSRGWQILNFSLVVTSAVFTGIGASSSATIWGAQPKIWSTLGGTTALGAVASTAKASVTSDQAALGTIDTDLDTWLKFLQTGKPNLDHIPTAQDIYFAAPSYVAKCTATANASTGKGSS